MRTSHKEMRRKINAEVSKITDEELFSSAAFAAYLTDIAEAVTKRYKRRLRVETIYDTSENAMIACTNNRNILINTGNYISQSMPYRKLKAESILGLVGHEVGHMLFTNFRISGNVLFRIILWQAISTDGVIGRGTGKLYRSNGLF